MQVLDLDKFVPEEKIVKLGNKEFDITVVPFEISLQIYDLIPMIQNLEKGEITEEDYDKLFNILYRILKNSNDEIDEKWLRKQINLSRFKELMPFIFSSVFGDESKKNEEGDDSEKST